MAELALDGVRRFHVTNVGGAGMSAVALLLAEMGHRVSGHDPAPDTPFLARLRERGVEVSTGGERPQLPPGIDAVVTSTATPDDDPDVAAARVGGIPVVHRAAALGALCALRRAVAVAGTHGKTTTSALLATVLDGAGQRPGFVIGASVTNLGQAAAWGDDKAPLVVEADESDGTFLALHPAAAVVTNVEPDHLDRWGGEAGLREAFERFVAGIAGPLVLGCDDPAAGRLAGAAGPDADVATYGSGEAADYRIERLTTEAGGVHFDLVHAGVRVAVVVPAAPGAHNAANAAAALTMAHRLGVPLAEGAAALAGFGGVARRYEHRGEAAGVTFVDDYAHLPAEVSAVLAAARGGSWSRVVCCFQPHRYSRTAALWGSFADAFGEADLLCVTDVYPAGEAPLAGVRGKLIADAVIDAHPRTELAWLPRLDDVVAYLRASLRPGDLCLTLGAGDLTTVPDRVLAALGGARS